MEDLDEFSLSLAYLGREVCGGEGHVTVKLYELMTEISISRNASNSPLNAKTRME